MSVRLIKVAGRSPWMVKSNNDLHFGESIRAAALRLAQPTAKFTF
jgi:hypothetical protein